MTTDRLGGDWVPNSCTLPTVKQPIRRSEFDDVFAAAEMLAAASLTIMPFLSWAQRRTGRSLASSAVVADSTQTLLCTYLSAVLLAGLVLNATDGCGTTADR